MIFPDFYDIPSTKPQLEIFDMLPKSGSSRHKRVNARHILDINEKGWVINQPIMMAPMITSSTNKQIPMRDSINDVTRRAKINGGKSKLLGTFPQTGNARHQPAGLFTMPEFRAVAIMPLPDQFYPALNSMIPALN